MSTGCHAKEWAELAAGTNTLTVASSYAAVTITRTVNGATTLYRLAGGRTDEPATWRARLVGCACERPTCPKGGRVRGYRLAGFAVRPNGATYPFGRAHPEACRHPDYCHGGIDGYTPADVVAVAERALESWAPAGRRPQGVSRPRPVRVPYAPLTCGCGATSEKAGLEWDGDGWRCPECFAALSA